MKHLAIDIGASGGRHIIGEIKGARLMLTEIYRFENGMVQQGDQFCWDIDALFAHIISGMQECAKQGIIPDSVGIDTWGVDYVLLDHDGQRIGPVVAYRDNRTDRMDQKLEETFSFEALYTRCGIAKQPFNTLYQLMATDPELLAQAKRFLFVPDYLHYLLTDQMKVEYTIASTSALLNAQTRDWDADILNAAGIPLSLFPKPPVPSGTSLGRLAPPIRSLVGFDCEVILPASHDTGSAYMAVPAKDESAVYLSSGTWSLLGVENDQPITSTDSMDANFTNEGGYNGSYRFLKNIMGLWMLQSIRREQGKKYTYAQMADMALLGKGYPHTINATDDRFLSPHCMIDEINLALSEQGCPLPANDAELFACINHSLAICYASEIKKLEQLTGKTFTSLNIVGGGSQNLTLNQWTADATGLPVYAGPGEGTALGNLIAQMIAQGELKDLSAARELIRFSFDIKTFTPQ